MSNQVAITEAVSLEASIYTVVSKSGKETKMGVARAIHKAPTAMRQAIAMQAQHKLADNQNWKSVMTDVMAVFPPSTIKVAGRTSYSKEDGTLYFISIDDDKRMVWEPLNAGTKITKALAMRYFEAIAAMSDEKDQKGSPYKGEKLAYADFAKDRLSIEAARKAEVAAQIAAKQAA